VTVLGPDPGQDQALQALVPAGTWQRTLPEPTVRLASCLVSPGFDFADLTMAEAD
jgi:predicted cupin superfamily sugar epimerase